jgi:hypothetical protein
LDFAKSEWAMIGSSDSPFLIRSRSIWQCWSLLRLDLHRLYSSWWYRCLS